MKTPSLAAGLLAGLALCASSASAQTTKIVNLQPLDFAPANLTIDLGDTVRWVWVNGFHDVKSGAGAIPDGIFDSGSPVFPPNTFEVTFDQAFLDANPVPGNVYNYFCSIHASSGMVGTVTVSQPPVVTPYGCLNPSGSLSSISGTPTVGDAWTVGVSNPLGTQPAGSLAFLGIASAPQLGFPCGIGVPGFGMSGPGGVGEILLSITAPDPFLTLGPTLWPGPGSTADFPVNFPANPNLLGVTFYFQGMVFDAGGTSGVDLGLTEGFAVTVGS